MPLEQVATRVQVVPLEHLEHPVPVGSQAPRDTAVSLATQAPLEHRVTAGQVAHQASQEPAVLQVEPDSLAHLEPRGTAVPQELAPLEHPALVGSQAPLVRLAFQGKVVPQGSQVLTLEPRAHRASQEPVVLLEHQALQARRDSQEPQEHQGSVVPLEPRDTAVLMYRQA